MDSLRSLPLPLLLAALTLVACDGGGDGPTSPGELRLSAASPVMSVAGPANDCAVFDVTIRDPSFRGGELDYLDTEVLRAADGVVIRRNRRPDDGFVVEETEVPRFGALVVEAGICWPPEPVGTELRIRVTVEVDPGDRRASLTLPVRDWRDAAPG